MIASGLTCEFSCLFRQGSCFGHQAVAAAYGANVTSNASPDLEYYLEYGARNVTVNTTARDALVAAGCSWAELLPDSYAVNLFHKEEARSFCV